jgi:GNAT superfamily N-acetyltransferase
MLLARKQNRVEGRIMGIINHKYNNAYNLKEGRFAFLETFEEYKVAHALILYIENWAKQKGMDKLVGPLGFSDKDPQGFLIEGFNAPVAIATNCNFPYLVNFVEKAGYEKKVDLVVYKLDIPEVIPEFYRRIRDRASKNNHTTRLISFTSRKQLKPYVKPVFELVNETFKEIYAFAPLSEREMEEFANRYLMILDPRFIKVVENDKGEVVSFILAMPDISEGIKKCKGRLIPFGIFMVFRAQRRTKQLNLLLGAIRPDYRNTGLDTIMGISMLEEARNRGMKVIDSHLELETNTKMRAEMEKMGGIVYKRFRIFQKAF